jgi:hypothetical protein
MPPVFMNNGVARERQLREKELVHLDRRLRSCLPQINKSRSASEISAEYGHYLLDLGLGIRDSGIRIYSHLHKVISRRHQNANRLQSPHHPGGVYLGQFCANRAQI